MISMTKAKQLDADLLLAHDLDEDVLVFIFVLAALIVAFRCLIENV